MATSAKKLQDPNVLKNADQQNDAPNPTPNRIALTPARRREIRRGLIADWRETFDILERHDRGEGPSDDNSN